MSGLTYEIVRLIGAPAVCTALWLASAITPVAAQQLPARPNAVRQQLSQAGPAPQAKPASALVKPAAAAPANPLTASQAPSSVPRAANRRDPFDPLVDKSKASGIPTNLPPGKAGLVIATLNLDGIVRGPNGMIAIVSNPQQRVYFLHQGDQLYDGQVGTITMEAVSFHQMGKDPFGAVIARDLTRRLYPSPGEQQ